MKSPNRSKKNPVLRDVVLENQLSIIRAQLTVKCNELEALQKSRAERELVIKEQLTRAGSIIMEAIAKIVSPSVF